MSDRSWAATVCRPASPPQRVAIDAQNDLFQLLGVSLLQRSIEGYKTIQTRQALSSSPVVINLTINSSTWLNTSCATFTDQRPGPPYRPSSVSISVSEDAPLRACTGFDGCSHAGTDQNRHSYLRPQNNRRLAAKSNQTSNKQEPRRYERAMHEDLDSFSLATPRMRSACLR